MTRDTDYLLHMGALEKAMELHEENHDLVERVDACNGSIHVIPNGEFDFERDAETIETWLEERVSDIPFTFSEWWYVKRGERAAIISPYWPTGGQVSSEQLAQYDDYLDDMESRVTA